MNLTFLKKGTIFSYYAEHGSAPRPKGQTQPRDPPACLWMAES